MTDEENRHILHLEERLKNLSKYYYNRGYIVALKNEALEAISKATTLEEAQRLAMQALTRKYPEGAPDFSSPNGEIYSAHPYPEYMDLPYPREGQ